MRELLSILSSMEYICILQYMIGKISSCDTVFDDNLYLET